MNGNVEMIRETLQQAQAIVIGAGAGLSAAAGLTYGGCLLYTSDAADEL